MQSVLRGTCRGHWPPGRSSMLCLQALEPFRNLVDDWDAGILHSTPDFERDDGVLNDQSDSINDIQDDAAFHTLALWVQLHEDVAACCVLPPQSFEFFRFVSHEKSLLDSFIEHI